MFQPLAVLEGPDPLNGGQIAFSPDGARLAAAGPEGEIQMWNLRDLRQRLAPLTVKVAGPGNY